MVTIRCGEIAFSNVQAVLFDKDGTLANVEAFLCDLADRRSQEIDARIPGMRASLLKAFGVERYDTLNCLNPAGLMAVGSRSENAIAAAAWIATTGRGWVESLNLVQASFQAADRSRLPKAKWTPLLPGAVSLLQKFSAAGLTLGILSSDSQSHVDEFIATYQLSHYFQAASGVQGNLSKADPSLVWRVLQKLDAAPEQTLMIGDAQIDVQIAETFGMAGCIGFTGGWSSKPNPLNAKVLIDKLNHIQVV